MRIKNVLTREEILIKKYIHFKYFCPHCKMLFVDIEKDHEIVDKSKCRGYRYQCKKCEKCFNDNTYSEQAQNGSNYNLQHSKSKIDIKKRIKEIIEELSLKGYNINNIKTITHFSRPKITDNLNFNEKVLNRKHFCMEYLKTNPDYYEAIMQRDPNQDWAQLKDFITDSIRKALKFGCNDRQIKKLLRVSSKTIDNARNREYFTAKKTYINEADKEERDIFIKQSENSIP